MMLYVISSVAVVICVVVGVFLERRRRTRSSWPADLVVIHKLGKGPAAPSLSPYPIKLETYLRMAKIHYVSDYKGGMSSKGKTPWMTYNGEVVADTDICINYINKKLSLDLNKHLNTQNKAVAKAFQRLVEDNLYWTFAIWRWVYNDDVNWAFLKRALMVEQRYGVLRMIFFSRRIWRQAWGQGMARHSRLEVMDITNTNLKALSEFIDKKPFLMGSEPCEEDCAVFGLLAQCVWHMPGSPHEMYIKEKYPNLQDYCLRMKERFWPDWEEYVVKDIQ